MGEIAKALETLQWAALARHIGAHNEAKRIVAEGGDIWKAPSDVIAAYMSTYDYACKPIFPPTVALTGRFNFRTVTYG